MLERVDTNKKIYIILTYTGTTLSKLIRAYTGAKYCHVSIALDKELEEMYSFGRINPYIPFIGGFVHESIYSGTFKRFKNTETEIYSIDVSDSQYDEMKNIINSFNSNYNEYSFNTIGLFAVGFNLKYKRENSFYCAEFVKYVIDSCHLKIDLPELVKPIDFQNKELMNLEYRGMLRKYRECV